MKSQSGSKTGAAVPSLDQSLQDIHADLALRQQAWAEQLARDPAAFARLKPQIHLVFQRLADQCAASLLAHAASPALADAAQKK